MDIRRLSVVPGYEGNWIITPYYIIRFRLYWICCPLILRMYYASGCRYKSIKSIILLYCCAGMAYLVHVIVIYTGYMYVLRFMCFEVCVFCVNALFDSYIICLYL